MNQKEQIRIVTELSNAIRDEIIRDIQAGKIPESWDGIELRWLLAERANNATYQYSKPRKREYNNTVLVNNL